jgi:hypothetical protein
MNAPEEPRFIGSRISFVHKKDLLTVIITQEVEKWKMAALLGWLILWCGVGAVFIYNWLNGSTSSDRLFFAIASAFWAFFLVRIGKVYIWRIIGREMIRIDLNGMSIKNAYGNFGKAQRFHLENIKEFGVINYDPNKFFQFMDRAFWTLGGDAIGFKHSGKRYQFAKLINDRDAGLLLRLMDKAMRDIQKLQKRQES